VFERKGRMWEVRGGMKARRQEEIKEWREEGITGRKGGPCKV
jgi:hypothetical protein